MRKPIPPSLYRQPATAAASLLVLLAASLGSGQSGPIDAEVSSAIASLSGERFADVTGPGGAVMVRLRGKVIFAQGYGRATIEEERANTPTTNFRLASITKQFTAAAILRLVDGEKLQWDETLTRIFPDFPEYGRTITVRHLLGHTSGLRDYEDLMPEGITEPILDAGVLEIMKAQQDGLFAPGTRYAYSNSGYAVLAMIVEARSGKSFATYLKDEFFAPLGMVGTVAYERGISEVANRAYGHKPEAGGGWRLADQSMTSSVLGDGGVYCSLHDYGLWADAWINGSILPTPLRELAWTNGVLDDGTITEYGLGWRVGEVMGHKVVHHTGSTTGFNNCVRMVPDAGLCVAVFANHPSKMPQELAIALEQLVLTAAMRASE